MKFAICNDIYEFGGNRLLDPVWSDRFPGTGWVSIFNKKAEVYSWVAASGDIAFSNVLSGYWDATEVFVIQEINSSYGRRLIEMGAKPLLLTCLESPLYASNFFDLLAKYGTVFPEVMAPALAKPHVAGRFWSMRFPCFWRKELHRTTPSWSDRKFLALIASNKYWSESAKAPSISKPRQYIHWLRNKFKSFFSQTRRNVLLNQLHDKRLELVYFFSNKNSLDVFGSRWDEFSHLPRYWREKFSANPLSNKGSISDKLLTLENYKFSICYENVSMPGYVTEKIIESLLVSTIPIYLGATDITRFIPNACFIDVRSFESPKSVYDYLISMSESDAQVMIDAGKKFLHSQSAYLHSYEGFADWVIDLAKSHEKKI